MCELVAMSCVLADRLDFSLRTLASRGGAAGNTHDGWGVAYYQGNDVALFREASSANESELVRHLESRGPRSRVAIAHIRRATRGAVCLANTQPFVRELGGRMHVFAHNGDLPDISRSERFQLGAFRPVGQTDSEWAFCALMARLQLLSDSEGPVRRQKIERMFRSFAADLRALGPANFLYSDGEELIAHAHRRIQVSTHRIEPPGLWMLRRQCPEPSPLSSSDASPDFEVDRQAVVLVASVPLTDEAWQPMAEGELIVIRDGQVQSSEHASYHTS